MVETSPRTTWYSGWLVSVWVPARAARGESGERGGGRTTGKVASWRGPSGWCTRRRGRSVNVAGVVVEADVSVVKLVDILAIYELRIWQARCSKVDEDARMGDEDYSLHRHLLLCVWCVRTTCIV